MQGKGGTQSGPAQALEENRAAISKLARSGDARRLMELLHNAPIRRFGLTEHAEDFTVFDLSDRYTIDPASFLSQGCATPFAGWEVEGRCRLTVCGGKIAYSDGLVPTEDA